MGWANWVLGLDGLILVRRVLCGFRAPSVVEACLVPVWFLVGRERHQIALWGYLGQPGLWCTQ
jgi:hypothetical protein